MKVLLQSLVFTAVVNSFISIAFAQEESPKTETVKAESESMSVQEDISNELGLIYSAKKLEEANTLIKENKFQEAEALISSVKEWLTEATEMHYSIYQLYGKQDKPVTLEYAKVEKAHAIDFGQLRDQSYYLLAKVYIAQNKFKDAAKLLVLIVKSEPNSGLGRESYKLLQDIKFSDRIK